MSSLLQNLIGMEEMTEQAIATDFLISSKSEIINYAMAISETVTPEVREILRRHMDAAIITHEKITNYMMSKGYYHVSNPAEQLRVDLQAADTVLNISQ